MPKKIDFTLTDEQVSALTQAMKHDKRSQVVHRATAVHLLHQGHKVADVAEMISSSPPIIYKWHRSFLASGVEGLANKKRKDVKRKVTDRYIAAMEEAVAHTPDHYGYTFAIWTRERLRDHLAQETGIHIHINWMGELLKKHDYVLRRPKHDLRHRQDPVARAEAEETLEVLKKRQEQTISSSSLWTKRR